MRPIPKELTRNGHGRMDESLKGCCFTGHRQIPQDLAPKLKQRVKDGIEYLYSNMGVKMYYAGGALGFDALAAEAVIEQRKKYPSISLVLVIPCRNQAVRWSAGDKAKYEQLKGDANEVICLAEHYFSGCIRPAPPKRTAAYAGAGPRCIGSIWERITWGSLIWRTQNFTLSRKM